MNQSLIVALSSDTPITGWLAEKEAEKGCEFPVASQSRSLPQEQRGAAPPSIVRAHGSIASTIADILDESREILSLRAVLLRKRNKLDGQ